MSNIPASRFAQASCRQTAPEQRMTVKNRGALEFVPVAAIHSEIIFGYFFQTSLIQGSLRSAKK